MHTNWFLKLFPPPRFLAMPFVGLDITDDSIHCLQYSDSIHGRKISKYACTDLPVDAMNGGEIKNEKAFVETLSRFAKENHITYAKVSLPEEKVYLFQTAVPSSDPGSIAVNIESKLEENVPVSAPDAVFYFDLMPDTVTGGLEQASVSVTPKTYIERYISILRQANIIPIAFEVVPKAIARAVVSADLADTEMIIHVMNKKTGINIVSDGVVCFSFTVPWGSRPEGKVLSSIDIAPLVKEINRIHAYWVGRADVHSKIVRAIVVGSDATATVTSLSAADPSIALPVAAAQVWGNAFDINEYIPPISQEDSFGYAAAAGLAFANY